MGHPCSQRGWRSLRAAALFTVCTLAACGSDSGTIASGADRDAGGDEDAICTAADECSASTPICSSDGVCVQCEIDADCPADAALCDANECVAGCAATSVAADFVTRPSDIIWVVDQSGSMDQETAHVQEKINDFAAIIDGSAIDYRVVMIADPNAKKNGICVPPPLAGPSCGDNDRFRLVPSQIGSHDGPQRAVEDYPLYQDFLRQDAGKHFVFVTDDNSDWSAATFTNELLALQPSGMFSGFKVHGIYAFGTSGGTGCDGPFGSGAAEGTVYTELIAQTGGAAGVICTGDWDQVFNDITAAVIDGSQVSCELEVPDPPDGETLDPSRVNVRYLEGGIGPGATIPRVDSSADCAAAGGWHYDDNAAPSLIVLCPATCSDVQNDPEASVQVELGCQVIVD